MRVLGLLVALVACGGETSELGASAGAGGVGSASGGASGQSSGGLANGGGCYDQGDVAITQAQREQVLSSACLVTRLEYPRTLELVVDLGADSDEPDPMNPGQTKWDTTRDALLTMLERDDEAGLAEAVHVGLRFASVGDTPGQAALDCGEVRRVPIGRLGAAASAQRTLLAAALREFRPREVPLRDLYAQTVSELLAATPLVAEPQVLLVSDGLSGLTECGADDGDYEGILEDVTSASSQSVRTFVVRTPGSAADPAWLAAIAQTGRSALPGCLSQRSACYYDLVEHPNLGAEVRTALWGGSVGFAAGCTALLPPSEIEPGLDFDEAGVLYTVAGQTTVIAPSCSEHEQCARGWWSKPDLSLQLCADTCELAKELTGVLEMTYGCGN